MNSPLEHPMLGTTNPRTKKFMHSITATLASRVESNAEVRIYMAGRSKVCMPGSLRKHQELTNCSLQKVAICPPPVVIFTFYRSDSHSFLQTSFVPEQTTWGAQVTPRPRNRFSRRHELIHVALSVFITKRRSGRYRRTKKPNSCKHYERQ